MLMFTPMPYRACQICSHGTDDLAGTRMCQCRAVVQAGQQKPVDQMRKPGGPCGPEAEHLDFPGLRG